MPGPLLSVTVAESYRAGFWAGPLIVVGHGIPELVLAIGFTMGLNRVLDNVWVKGIVGVLGGLFLLWLGIKILVEVERGIEANLGKKGEVGWGPVVAGMWASLSNPGWVVWWATVGATYIMLSLKHGIAGLVAFYVGHIMADFLWYSLVSYLVATGRGRISDKVYHWALRACAIMVIGFAVYFVIYGIKTLL